MEQVIDKSMPAQAFTIEAFLPRKSGTHESVPSFQPYAIKRLHDNEVFAIGDTITTGDYYQGKLMQGVITHFEMLEGYVFVHHTWSGIGFNLGSVMNINKMRFKTGDKVSFSIKQSYGKEPWECIAEVKGVHDYNGHVKYDLEIPVEGDNPTRIYNINSCFVFPVTN